jgi:glycosyltransferase involved in cell wall biosynthesis
MKSERPSILQVSGPISNKLGGPSQVVKNLHSRFSKLGFDISRSKTLVIQDEFFSSNLNPKATFFKKPLFPNNYGLFFGKLPKSLCDQIEQEDFDFVLLHGFFMWSTLWAVWKLKNSQIVLMPHGSLEPYELQKSRIRKNMFILLVKKVLKQRTIHFFIASESEKFGVLKHFEDSPIYVVGLGIDLHRSITRVSDVENHYRIISNSRIAQKKRIDLTIGALTWLPSNYELVVTGDTDNRLGKSLIKLALSRGLESRVLFYGHLETEEVDKLLQISDYLVLPSENENFAISVAEALHNGIPVILSNNVAISVLVKKYNAGIVIENLSERDIAEAIEKISLDYSDYSERARLAAAQLDWDFVILEWINSFSKITSLGDL